MVKFYLKLHLVINDLLVTILCSDCNLWNMNILRKRRNNILCIIVLHKIMDDLDYELLYLKLLSAHIMLNILLKRYNLVLYLMIVDFKICTTVNFTINS